MQISFVICIILFGVISTSAATECFACSSVQTVAECKTTKTCNADEICFTDFLPQGNRTLYSFGCRSETNCTSVVSNTGNMTNGASLVGRSLPMSPCSQCCKENHCNRHMCQQTYSLKECSDRENIDCVTLEQFANICADTQRALSVCRRFCGLCSYVDGQWASWLAWTSCDVTCGDGHQSRKRTCTEPAPAGGGNYCQGHSDEIQRCTFQPCPVHGHWSTWSGWGSCSTTCGIGMQRRDRTCSNPYPARFGDHCYGDSRDDRLCVDAVCPVTDGGWSTWTPWTACTASCGGGIKSHYRDCNNPMPSAGGKICTGLQQEMTACNQNNCPLTDGGWSTWTSWTTCTASCGGGIKSHYRDCNNPMPSAGGRLCTGLQHEVTACNHKNCPRKLSSFSYTHPVEVEHFIYSEQKGSMLCHTKKYMFHAFIPTLPACSTVAFDTKIFEEGSSYNSKTGDFTCSYPGVYVFMASLISSAGSKIDCDISKNDHTIANIIKNPSDSKDSISATITLQLQRGDRISLFCQHASSILESSSTFSGFLVRSDS